MGIKYKTIQVDIPADGEAVDVILSVPTGSTYRISALGRDSVADFTFIASVGDARFLELPHDLDIGWGAFIPINLELAGPATLRVGATDQSGAGGTRTYSVAYEE